MYKYLTITIIMCCMSVPVFAQEVRDYRDDHFFSEAFQTERWYRIYLPQGYEENAEKRYPVIYYFHGWGGRYKWDSYDLKDDPGYPENGRKEPPFVMEWSNYVKDHEVIIVTWDGYEPNLHQGLYEREGIPYGGASPYDYVRAHESEEDNQHWGWDYRMYFRDLVAHIDSAYRTEADRNHRAVTGLSMGGLTSWYVAGQNKDLICSVSAFDPADNLPLYGPKGRQVVFPVLEMYRPLRGLDVRLTMTDGDWLKYNDLEMKRLWEADYLTHFEFHEADFPDHWAGDADQQLDFHMRSFEKDHQKPDNWNHLCPAFPAFRVWGYEFGVDREKPALTLIEDAAIDRMTVLSRYFIPDGPIVKKEKISITTSGIYRPSAVYRLNNYNLSTGSFDRREITASGQGKLSFDLDGGGHIVGINGPDAGNGPVLWIVPAHNAEYQYFEVGKRQNLDFRLVNTGLEDAYDIEIEIVSDLPELNMSVQKLRIRKSAAGSYVEKNNAFDFMIERYSDSSSVGSLVLKAKINEKTVAVQRMMFFSVPESPYVPGDDVLILDGRTVKDVPIYVQGRDTIGLHDLTGGKGNGNGILERGEEVLVYIKLEKGMAPKDVNTYHRTCLINSYDDPYLKVEKLHYEEKMLQAGATSISTVLSVAGDAPAGHEFDLWFKVESLYNDKDDPTSRAIIYAHKYDYCRVKLNDKQAGKNYR